MGIGRKSPMILDNLGISIVDIRNEMEKTGDMAKAVANIIDREMANAGNTVDTSATKVAQMTTAWTNFKTILGSLFTGGVANSFSWLTNWLNETNRILSSETIPWYEKLAATLGQVIPGMGVSRSATSSKLNKEESRKKGIDTEAGLLAANMPKSTETSATKLDKWIKSQKELLSIEPCFPIRLSMTLEEEGYDLRYTEWSEKPSKKYGYNPFKKFDRLEHWSTISSSVYFVENSLNGLIKIGYSGNYPTRMAQLNNQYKAKLKILGLMDGGLSEEKSIHKLFSENQVEGEWFSGCQAIRDFIIEYCYLPIISVPTGQ